MNLSKTSASVSVGRRGARLTYGSRGRRATVGLPGTGLFYTTHQGRAGGRRASAVPVDEHPGSRLTMGFFQRLVTPREEEAFVDGCRHLAQGHEEEALRFFLSDRPHADSAFMAGFLALKRQRLTEAEDALIRADRQAADLGKLFAKYGLSASLRLPVTPEVEAHVDANRRGALLGLVEVYQEQNRPDHAIACLDRLRQLAPSDVVVHLSLAELLLDAHGNERAACKRAAGLGQGVTNESAIHAALMLYRGRALQRLGLASAAIEVLTAALRRRKDRPADLLHAIRYERALAYESANQRARARREFERLYAEAPDYDDVAARLDMA